MVLGRIREATFKLNLEMCTYAAREVAYLCHILSADGVSPDASKVNAIKSFPLTRNVRDGRVLYPGLVPIGNVSWLLRSEGGEARASVRTRR